MNVAAARPKPAKNALGPLDALAAKHSEWRPWLCVVREVIVELSDPVWETHPPDTASGSALAPQLADAVLRPDGRNVARLLDRLRTVARAEGLSALAGPAGPATPVHEALAVFLASVNGDEAALDRQASRAGATPEGWRALAQLLPMPYLHACARRWTAGRRGSWSQGYCPVCGAWPAFAELRGVERARHLRCGRCGAGWPRPALTCAYCATTDHDKQGTLVAGDAAPRWAVDVCQHCLGYLKSCTTLLPTPDVEVLAADLASVEFDLAAVERGFLRPPAIGVALNATLAADETAPAASGRP